MTDTSGISAEDAVEAIDGEFLVVLGRQFLGEKGFTNTIGADTLVFDTAAEATEAANLLKSKVDADFRVVRYENDAATEKTSTSEPSDATAATADGTDNGTNECGESKEDGEGKWGTAGKAVEILAELVGGTPLHEKVKGLYDTHSIEVGGDKYRFVIVRRPWDNLVVYKNDEPGEFFAFDSDLSSDKFRKQKEEFVKMFETKFSESENPYLSEADFDENGDFVQNKDSFVDTRGKDGELITEAGEPIDASAAVQSAFEAFGALPSQLASVVPAIDGALRTINQSIQQSQGNGVVFQGLGIDTTQNPASTNDVLRPLVAKLNNMRMLIQQTVNTLSAQG